MGPLAESELIISKQPRNFLSPGSQLHVSYKKSNLYC